MLLSTYRMLAQLREYTHRSAYPRALLATYAAASLLAGGALATTTPLSAATHLTAPIAALTAATLTAVILTYTTAATPDAATDITADDPVTSRGEAIAQHYHATLGIATHAIGVGIITTAATILLPAVHPAAPRGIEVLAFSAAAYYAIIVTTAAARLVEYARIQQHAAL